MCCHDCLTKYTITHRYPYTHTPKTYNQYQKPNRKRQSDWTDRQTRSHKIIQVANRSIVWVQCEGLMTAIFFFKFRVKSLNWTEFFNDVGSWFHALLALYLTLLKLCIGLYYTELRYRFSIIGVLCTWIALFNVKELAKSLGNRCSWCRKLWTSINNW